MAIFMQVGDVYVNIKWIYQPGSLKAEFHNHVRHSRAKDLVNEKFQSHHQ